MRESEKIRLTNSINDLLGLKVESYCDLGPDNGFIPLSLSKKGKKVSCIEGPYEFDKRTSWKKGTGITVYKGEFFSSCINDLIKEKIQCFSLIHAIAHFRFPHILFKQIYNKLEPKGYFYLSTVNGGSLEKVVKHLEEEQ